MRSAINKLFDGNEPSIEEILNPPYDHFFERDDVAIPNPDKIEKKIKKIIEEVEEIPARFYEEGMITLEIALMLRMIEAMEHWKGTENFNLI